jgi:hypothetical protein
MLVGSFLFSIVVCSKEEFTEIGREKVSKRLAKRKATVCCDATNANDLNVSGILLTS